LEKTWKIVNIFDASKALRKQFEDGSIFVELVSPSVSMSDVDQSYFEELEDEFRLKKHGKLIKREVITFPLAREVTLLPNGFLPKGTDWSWSELKGGISVIIRSDMFPALYDLLGNYYKGVRIASREERYRNLYQVYECLSEEQDNDLKAIRHSLSHSRKKMTNKTTVEILHSLFGDTKINLLNPTHAKVFRKKIELLKDESERLLVKEILKIVPSSKNFLDKYYVATP